MFLKGILRRLTRSLPLVPSNPESRRMLSLGVPLLSPTGLSKVLLLLVASTPPSPTPLPLIGLWPNHGPTRPVVPSLSGMLKIIISSKKLTWLHVAKLFTAWPQVKIKCFPKVPSNFQMKTVIKNVIAIGNVQGQWIMNNRNAQVLRQSVEQSMSY